MKVVFLIAGKGRRLKTLTEKNHKSLINLDENSVLYHLIENFIYAGFKSFIPIVGHCTNKILSEFDKTYSQKIEYQFVENKKFNTTNNLYSLYCAKDILQGEEFILCNADIILDREIINGIGKIRGKSLIAVDGFNYSYPIDSPGIKSTNNRILDLGRHIPFKQNNGYAIGVYKFNKELSNLFFKEAKLFLEKDLNAGFHDPLTNLFNKIKIEKFDTKHYLWTDIDTFDDIEKAKNLNDSLTKKYEMKKAVIYNDLKGKTVVITGAGEGIGEAISRRFLEQGSKVILISRSKINWLNEFHPSQYEFLKKDIQDLNYFDTWLKEYSSHGNSVDILINNAGVISKQNLLDVTNENWDEIVNINSKATFFLSKIFAKHMIENSRGNIIFASSFANIIPSIGYGIYAASKSMISSLSKSFAAELAPYGIRVNSFSPGVIKTKMTEKARSENAEKMLKDISLKRFGLTDEVAMGVLFLASECSSYIHGSDLDISGGKFIVQNSK